MPSITSSCRLGRHVLAGLAGLSASAALAGQPQLLVSDSSADQRVVRVEVADLDPASAYDRQTLAIRIDKAARHVCDVTSASKLDRLPDARACLAQARSGAADQLEARGLQAYLALAEHDARQAALRE